MKSDIYEDKSHDFEKNPQSIFDESRIILFRERLRQVIGDESVHSFSRRCDLSEATLRGYLRGGSYPTIDRLNKIAITANTSMTWLIGEEEAMAMPGDQAGQYLLASEHFMDDYVLLPGYRVQVSAGDGAVAA